MPSAELSRMDSPPKLTGETLIVHHIPLVHCQVPDRQCCGGGGAGNGSSRTNPFCPPELGHPDRDLTQADSLLYSRVLPASGGAVGPGDGPKSRIRDGRGPGVPKRHNPFLMKEGEPEEPYGDCGSSTQQSFHLHGNRQPPFQLATLGPGTGKTWGATNSRAGVVEGQEQEPLSSSEAQKCSHGHHCPPELEAETMELDEGGGPGASDTSGFSFDQEWKLSLDESPRNPGVRACGCSGSGSRHCRCSSTSSQSEVADQSMGYVSDSSCNSSDGVLVTFSALYNKMHGHSRANLNSAPLSCSDSSFCSHSDPGAFYLDLHTSPAESKMSCESHHPDSGGGDEGCGYPHAASPELDANCNSYRPHCEPCPAAADLTACFQSQARLVVATQNYYKLVTCDLSSQSSPSPAGSSITSCSEEHTKGSPGPVSGQPTEYYLFQKPETHTEEQKAKSSPTELGPGAGPDVIEGQVYVNVSPPNLSGGRQRSRSYDRSLERSPPNRLGSLERMLSCPVRLSEGPSSLAGPGSPPRRVTSFAELAKGRKKVGGSGSPPLRLSTGDSSLEFSPIPESQRDGTGPLDEGARCSHSLPSLPLGLCLDPSSLEAQAEQGSRDGLQQGPQSNEVQPTSFGTAGQASLALLMEPSSPFSAVPASSHAQRDIRARADGGSAENRPVLRYSKEQRPTTLPIQPFVFQHHFPKQLPKTRALHSLSQLYSLSGSNRSQAPVLLAPTSQGSVLAPSAQAAAPAPRTVDGAASLSEESTRKAAPDPDTSRPSPLGSYSPIRSSGPFGTSTDSSSASGSPPEHAVDGPPPRSRSCPAAANLIPVRQALMPGPTPQLEAPERLPPEPSPLLSEYRLHGAGNLSHLGPTGPSLSRAESLARGGGEGNITSRLSKANHLSPQALKWREYRRKNPLGPPGLGGSLDRRPQETRLARRNPLFEFPGPLNAAGHLQCRLNGQAAKQLPLNHADFFSDPFSLAEKPPAEFCLSPDGNTEAVSIDLLQKKGLVKDVNTAVDLIVAHFGTSRDPGVKAKLGNSSVSPNVGHLVLKYLCPAVQAVLGDGLKAFVLDVIIGQRKNMPWSVVEASTQLGPSTKILHGLYNKVSQFPELTSHTMRFNAFILGLLNIRSLEFWFNHLYNHEDIIQAHYQPWGFLSAAHTVCPGLFEELLLLLQPLALLPFNLDLLFQHRLLQNGRQQQQQKELLRVSQGLLLSAHSTLQLARAREQESHGGTDGAAPGERVKGVGAPAGGEEEEKVAETVAEVQAGAGQGGRARSGQAGWWYQLMQSSQVYIDGSGEGSRFPRSSEKKKVAGGSQAPPPREGVVEGAEACPTAEEAPSRERGWPFWMGSPPDSVLAELRRSREREGPVAPQGGSEEGTQQESTSGGIKWGHLFGSRKTQREARPLNRLPSDWLSLDKSVFQLVAQTVGARRESESRDGPEEPPALDLPPNLPCEVQALCHHLATGPGQLSFCKGDVLRVLGPAGGDWLRCGRGSDTGLVPLAYVTPAPTPTLTPRGTQD
ncbi:iporin isoform X1 [Sarcophilus harrisii]|uniref:RUN and SH3 domain containing 2 n=1 Tax=Sarcophilus harrisii TaxID=9305 RepID=A0A7N4PQU4_SARHA|nr:iporin isoform X1 [Sarcophilus harrisii]XP_023353411.1 iporin isoform X1 [Sarcophilus harrisii]XP_031801228.1 iporin isoform X1 [Sarcophilus harrisii]XP_031801229.1 iporin isoform X1 [Sarcophilus harrisii]